MVTVNGVPETTSVSVYRKMNSHLNGRAATQVMAAQGAPDAGFRSMGEKATAIRIARRERSNEQDQNRTARHMPANVAMDQAVQNQIDNPQDCTATKKTIDAVRDMRSGVFAGPKPASVVHSQNRAYRMRMNGYV